MLTTLLVEKAISGFIRQNGNLQARHAGLRTGAQPVSSKRLLLQKRLRLAVPNQRPKTWTLYAGMLNMGTALRVPLMYEPHGATRNVSSALIGGSVLDHVHLKGLEQGILLLFGTEILVATRSPEFQFSLNGKGWGSWVSEVRNASFSAFIPYSAQTAQRQGLYTFGVRLLLKALAAVYIYIHMHIHA